MLKLNNKLLILRELKKWDLSRTEISGITGLSNSTVSSLVNELTSEKLIFEKSIAQSTGGRKPIIFSLNESATFVLVIKVLPKEIKAAIVNLKLQIVYRQALSYKSCNETVIKSAITKIIDDTLKKSSLPKDCNFSGIGISLPGLIDHASNTVIYSSHLHLSNFNIMPYLKNFVNDNVYIFKDVDALMLGTYALENLKNNAGYLYFLVDSGVGLSFLNNGQLLQLNRSGMEIGHVQLEPGGHVCSCGKQGCVETFVSEQAAQKRYCQLNDRSKLSNKDIPNLNEMVFKSNRGDSLSRQVLSEQCKYLGKAVACAVNIFAPNEVFIGGPMSNIKWNAIDIIEESMHENVLNNFSDISIKFTDSTEDSDFIGMANTIINREFFSTAPFSF